MPVIASALNLSDADIHGVITFYHDFKQEKPGKNTIQICRAEACQAMGSRQLEIHAKAKLGLDWHETTADRNFTLEPVYCLGNCACAPSVKINDTILADMTGEKLDQQIEALSLPSIEVKEL